MMRQALIATDPKGDGAHHLVTLDEVGDQRLAAGQVDLASAAPKVRATAVTAVAERGR